MRLGLVGLGLGYSLAKLFSYVNNDVAGVDIDARAWESPRLDGDMKVWLEGKEAPVKFSSSFSALSDREIILIFVSTPLRGGRLSIANVVSALEAATQSNRTAEYSVLSTLPTGGMAVLRGLFPGIKLNYSPPMVKKASFRQTFVNPPSGWQMFTEGSSDSLRRLFASLQVGVRQIVASDRVVELAKLCTNLMLSAKIILANSIGDWLGADAANVCEIVDADPRIGRGYFAPGGPASGPCVLPSCLVQTSEGLRRIDSLAIGDLVLSHDGNFHKVSKIYVREYEGNLVTVSPRGNVPFSLTPEHPVMFSPRVESKPRFIDINIGPQKDGYQRSGHRLKTFTDLRLLPIGWHKACAIERGDILAYPIPKFPPIPPPIVKVKRWRNQLAFTETSFLLSPDISRLIGYYLAEGSTWKGEVKFDFHRKEVAYHKDVLTILAGMGLKGKARPRGQNGVAIKASSKWLAQFLRDGFGSHVDQKRLPPAWLGLPRELKVGLLQGLWYGDGSASGGCYTYASISTQLANQVHLLLLSLGIVSTVRRAKERIGRDGTKHKTAYFVRVRHSREIKKLEELLPLLLMKGNRRKSDARTLWIEDDYLRYMVGNISSSTYAGEVYNLEVEQANSYCIQGGVLHNCLPRDLTELEAASSGSLKDILRLFNRVNGTEKLL